VGDVIVYTLGVTLKNRTEIGLGYPNRGVCVCVIQATFLNFQVLQAEKCENRRFGGESKGNQKLFLEKNRAPVSGGGG
jgi:hypothetical protein